MMKKCILKEDDDEEEGVVESGPIIQLDGKRKEG
jgi:hypothetical protein